MNVVADGRRPQRVFSNRAKDDAHRRAHDAQRHHHPQEEAEGEEWVERPAGRELERREAEVEARCRHAGEPVLAAGPLGERVELDEIEDLGDRDGDHREVDARAPQGDEAHEVAHHRRGDHADHKRRDDVRKSRAREQVRRDHAAGAIERRLPERKQSGVAEEDVEADPEEPPHQDPVDGVRGSPEVGQDEGCGEEPCRNQHLGDARDPPARKGDATHSRPGCPRSPCGRSISTSVIAANSIT